MFSLILQGNSGNYVKLHMTELKYLGAVDLTQYFVKSYDFSDTAEYQNISLNGNTGVRVDFLFSRRLLNQALTVFMPTVIFGNHCCYLARFLQVGALSDCYCNCLLLHKLFQGIYIFYNLTQPLAVLFMIFQPSDFEANVTVNVTMLLVLTTLFISISDALPRTSYVKLVDIWLITNLLIPFFEIILQSLMNAWYMDYKDNDTKILRVAPMNQGIKNNDNIVRKAVRKNEKLLNIMRLKLGG